MIPVVCFMASVVPRYVPDEKAVIGEHVGTVIKLATKRKF